MDRQLALGGELFYKESSYFSDYYDQTNAGGAISLRKPLGPKSSIKGEYRLENVNIDSDVDANDIYLNGTRWHKRRQFPAFRGKDRW